MADRSFTILAKDREIILALFGIYLTITAGTLGFILTEIKETIAKESNSIDGFYFLLWLATPIFYLFFIVPPVLNTLNASETAFSKAIEDAKKQLKYAYSTYPLILLFVLLTFATGTMSNETYQTTLTKSMWLPILFFLFWMIGPHLGSIWKHVKKWLK